MNITLVNRAISKVYFKNKTYLSKSNTGISLESKQETRVDFDFENNRLICTISVHMTEENSEPSLEIDFEIVGFYVCEEPIGEADKNELHVMACQNLYPYLVEAIASLTSGAGISPIILPPLSMVAGDITKVDE